MRERSKGLRGKLPWLSKNGRWKDRKSRTHGVKWSLQTLIEWFLYLFQTGMLIKADRLEPTFGRYTNSYYANEALIKAYPDLMGTPCP
jgi:hypothetical protein